DPLTDLWLETADVDRLLDQEVSAVSRFAKAAAVPVAWALSARRGGDVEKTVDSEQRGEIRAKLANFVRARWFAPPFSGSGFTHLLLDAFDAMAKQPAGPPLLPHYQPLDLFVTVTDFHGYPEQLRLNSPPVVMESEHRLILSFRDEGGPERHLADTAELAFAARATASFPGAFPPFQVAELDSVLEKRDREWPGRSAFLERTLGAHGDDAENAVLIDGSVLANAPFRPAIEALTHRPTRREVDRRFVYIDPKPGSRAVQPTGAGNQSPGFFATIFGALSDIPREQPIRDNLEAIEERSARIRRFRRILEAMRPEVESAVERCFGHTLLLGRPTPARIAGWRARVQTIAAREAGYAFAAYGHFKLSTVAEDVAGHLMRIGGLGQDRHEGVQGAVWQTIRRQGIADPEAMTATGAKAETILFFRRFDLSFRIRRLRFLARRLGEVEQQGGTDPQATEQARTILYTLIGRYGAAAEAAAPGPGPLALIRAAETNGDAALDALAGLFDLKSLDDEADASISEMLAAFPKAERRLLILTYLGFPFYDIATLPLLQGEGLDEYDPVKVDRISPEDATAIRSGSAATLKGTQFNSFGAFFSRAYRENDYLWGRLHGAERLIDIVVSAIPEGESLTEQTVKALKRQAFRAILEEEKSRLRAIPSLFKALDSEIG
ncbi:MAG: patatin-like protein, partial [Alphaproteobacteria bacterium]